MNVLSEQQKKLLIQPGDLVLEKNDQNVAQCLTNFMCNLKSPVDKSEKGLLAKQHRIAKDLFDWEEIANRLKNCQNYSLNFGLFFQVSSLLTYVKNVIMSASM